MLLAIVCKISFGNLSSDDIACVIEERERWHDTVWKCRSIHGVLSLDTLTCGVVQGCTVFVL